MEKSDLTSSLDQYIERICLYIKNNEIKKAQDDLLKHYHFFFDSQFYLILKSLFFWNEVWAFIHKSQEESVCFILKFLLYHWHFFSTHFSQMVNVLDPLIKAYNQVIYQYSLEYLCLDSVKKIVEKKNIPTEALFLNEKKIEELQFLSFLWIKLDRCLESSILLHLIINYNYKDFRTLFYLADRYAYQFDQNNTQSDQEKAIFFFKQAIFYAPPYFSDMDILESTMWKNLNVESHTEDRNEDKFTWVSFSLRIYHQYLKNIFIVLSPNDLINLRQDVWELRDKVNNQRRYHFKYIFIYKCLFLWENYCHQGKEREARSLLYEIKALYPTLFK